MLVLVNQFIGLLRLVEFNSFQALASIHPYQPTAYCSNALLAAYAALEALILETAFELQPNLYAQKGFRMRGLADKYQDYLQAAGRIGEGLPSVIAEVSDARIAITHSEPDNARSRMVSKIADPFEVARINHEIRVAAIWLWQGEPPPRVGLEFFDRNIYLPKIPEFEPGA